MSTNNKLKHITGMIADASGHTDFAGTIDDAVNVIMENVTKFGKWAYFNDGVPYIRESYGPAEAAEMKEILEAADEPYFLLTPAIQGGASDADIRAQYVAFATR